MIDFRAMGVTYPDAPAPVLSDVTLHIPEGELCLVVGGTGSGKSTLLGTVNGLVPHFSGGTLHGRVTVDGRSTHDHPPRELADVVGVVGQDPRATFVADVVENELAYTMESLALPSDVMRRRVEDTLDLLGLVELRHRAVSTLSGGEAQRVAIGAVLGAHPRVLVLDEPTSALDPAAAEDVLAALQRLVHDLGLTVLMAEHRLERVIQYADSVVWLPGGGRPIERGTPGRHHGPLADRAASRRAGPHDGLGAAAVDDPRCPASRRGTARDVAGPAGAAGDAEVPGEVVASTSGVTVRYGSLVAVNSVDLRVRAGEIVAVMGRNGAGKSSLFGVLTGLVKPAAGRVSVGGTDPRALRGRELIGKVGLVPQQPADLLYAETVALECAAADRESDRPDGTAAALLRTIAGDVETTTHPRDLSEGQRLALALAVVLTAAPPLVLLDEPTRGLDYAAKARLVLALRALAARGHAIMLATHDVELAAQVSDRTLVLADGEIVAQGPSRDVVTQSPMFAPQIAKVLAPLPYLTLADVRRTLAMTDVGP